jgi:RimJ/RimL family protein N-acetyltransferase
MPNSTDAFTLGRAWGTPSSTATTFSGSKTPITLRPIRPDDEPALRAGFAKLSVASRYARFRGHFDLTSAQWTYLTHVDGHDHVALVAVVPSGEIVGVARFVRIAEGSNTAEVAFTVADEHQSQGLGRRLLAALLPLARACGVSVFEAYTSADNLGMVRLFAAFGGSRTSTHQSEAVLTLSTTLRVHDAA